MVLSFTPNPCKLKFVILDLDIIDSGLDSDITDSGDVLTHTSKFVIPFRIEKNRIERYCSN